MKNKVIADDVSIVEAQRLKDDPDYRCCCNRMSIQLGSVILCVVEILLAIIQFLFYIIIFVNDSGDSGYKYYGILGTIVTIILATLALIAINKEICALLLLNIRWMLVDTFFAIVTAVPSIGLTKYSKYTSVWILFAIGCFIRAGLPLLAYRIMFKLYLYIEEKTKFNVPKSVPQTEFQETNNTKQGFPPSTSAIIDEQQEKLM